AVRHRGPDGEGVFARGPAALGHRRLSIIDPETGDQPMSTADGAVVLSFNGEIYNYVELREELRALGHRFRTTSDTEVLLHAYEEWDLDCHCRLNGMWAFALWDDRKQRLLLSRDRLGEKPLHYAVHDDTLVFGSEMKSLFAFGVPRQPRSDWAEVYACLSYLPAPHTFFDGVAKLPAGSYLLWQDGRAAVHRHWELPLVDEERMRTDAVEVEAEFAALFSDSVRLRMRSDVPYGAFLSGGLDSSCIVATMAGIGSHPVRTFTIGFPEDDYDERRLARLVAEAFGSEHREEVVEPAVFDESLARVMHHSDEPFGDTSAIPTGQVSQAARRHVKMVLTGDGGDEALSGYTIYQGEKFAERYGRLPRAVQTAIPSLAGGIAQVLSGRARSKLNRVRNVGRTSSLDSDRRLIEKTAWTDTSLIKALFAGGPAQVPIEELVADLMRPCPYRDPFYRLMYYNLMVSLPDRMLVKVDRMSMAHSLEVRAPFLDHRMIELLAVTHKDVKMRGYERKSILRRTVARKLPAPLLRAPKKGFAVPVGDWFTRSDLARRVDTLAGGDGLGLAAGPLRALQERNRRGERDIGNLLWMLMLLDRFQRQFG
ncbi:MAG: asparagine synthase (glutamine-hydrolyzing), partial [Candidatus Eisenbacteria bacterium]|nr:asparagine synthase (glutamine-hydrolyzing) [Candidatus Latescibacterota bacterium]MBD3302816.1 asparagine synthase (glutamine-hydrolyzing) [Candidatus Eisenbacteria bacterium]